MEKIVIKWSCEGNIESFEAVISERVNNHDRNELFCCIHILLVYIECFMHEGVERD